MQFICRLCGWCINICIHMICMWPLRQIVIQCRKCNPLSTKTVDSFGIWWGPEIQTWVRSWKASKKPGTDPSVASKTLRKHFFARAAQDPSGTSTLDRTQLQQLCCTLGHGRLDVVFFRKCNKPIPNVQNKTGTRGQPMNNAGLYCCYFVFPFKGT